jgi:uncharacterized protein with GYD domain
LIPGRRYLHGMRATEPDPAEYSIRRIRESLPHAPPTRAWSREPERVYNRGRFRAKKEISVEVSVCNKEERRMSHFVTLIRYTQQGAAKIKESPARLDAAKKAAEKAGGKIHAWYLTMGKYDAVIISEFPSDEASAKFMLATGAMGNVTTQTLKAFTEAEYRKIVGSL